MWKKAGKKVEKVGNIPSELVIYVSNTSQESIYISIDYLHD